MQVLRNNRTRKAPTGTENPAVPESTPDDTLGSELPLVLNYSDMNIATEQGEVTVLGSTAGYVVKYRDVWWIADDRGWVRVVVDEIAAVLDAEHARMAAQDAIITEAAAIRSAIASDRGTNEPGPGACEDTGSPA